MEPRIVKDNLEMIILAKFSKPKCGIDLIKEISRELGVIISPGTLYPYLHSMEEGRLVTIKKHSGNKMIYSRTKKGSKRLAKLIKDHQKLLANIKKVIP